LFQRRHFGGESKRFAFFGLELRLGLIRLPPSLGFGRLARRFFFGFRGPPVLGFGRLAAGLLRLGGATLFRLGGATLRFLFRGQSRLLLGGAPAGFHVGLFGATSRFGLRFVGSGLRFHVCGRTRHFRALGLTALGVVRD
jgi:hypothetical protein